MGPRRDLPKLLGLERFDILKAIGHAATELHEARPLTEPAPAFQGARADLPAAGKLDLIEVVHRPGGVRRRRSRTRSGVAA